MIDHIKAICRSAVLNTVKSTGDESVDQIALTIKREVEALALQELNDLDQRVFIKSTFIDSVHLVNLIVYLEDKYGIELEAFFVDRESVSTVNKLAWYIHHLLLSQNAAN